MVPRANRSNNSVKSCTVVRRDCHVQRAIELENKLIMIQLRDCSPPLRASSHDHDSCPAVYSSSRKLKAKPLGRESGRGAMILHGCIRKILDTGYRPREHFPRKRSKERLKLFLPPIPAGVFEVWVKHIKRIKSPGLRMVVPDETLEVRVSMNVNACLTESWIEAEQDNRSIGPSNERLRKHACLHAVEFVHASVVHGYSRSIAIKNIGLSSR
jgi:hypothetical protein